MKKLLTGLSLLFAGGLVLFSSCREEEPVEPPKAGIFFSVAEKQVAFTALTKRAETFLWEFGDGETSTEQNPVHLYKEGGIYDVKLTVNGEGGSAEAVTEVSLALSDFQMLTGGSKAVNGKKWRIKGTHSSKDALTLADDKFTPLAALSPGILGSAGLGLPEVYEDEFIFKSDGSYIHAPKNGGAFAGLVYSMINQKNILKATPMSQQYGLCYTAWVPEAGAKFTLNEKKDLTLAVTNYPSGTAAMERTYSGVMTLTFSGNEFIGFMDFTREVIVQELTNETMRLVLFMCATQKAHYNKPSNAIILTFEVVK